MRRFLFTCSMLVALTLFAVVSATAQTVINMDLATFSKYTSITNYSNPDGFALADVVIKSDDGKVAVKFQKGEGRTNPAFDVKGDDYCVETFGISGSTGNGNVVTVTSETDENITKVTLNLYEEMPSVATIKTDVGTISFPDAKTVVWTGDAKEVKLYTARTDNSTDWFRVRTSQMVVDFPAPAQSSEVASIVMDAKTLGLDGLANPDGQAIPGKVVYSADNSVKLTFAKGEGKANPTYKQPASGLSCVNTYAASGSTAAGNTMTFASEKNMGSITITLAADAPANAALTCSTGEIKSVNATTYVWTGNATEVVIGTASTDATTGYVIVKAHKFDIEFAAPVVPQPTYDAAIVMDAATLDLAALANPDGQAIPSKVAYSADNSVKLTFAKGEGKANPTYKQPAEGLSCVNTYAASGSTAAGNTMTLKSEKAEANLGSITIALAAEMPANATFTCSTGAIEMVDATTAVWTGNAEEVVIGTASTDATTSYLIVKVHSFGINFTAPAEEPKPALPGFVFSAENLGGVEEGASVHGKSMTVDGFTLSFDKYYASAAPYYHKAAAEEGVVMLSQSYFAITGSENITSVKIYTAEDASLDLSGYFIATEGEVVYDEAAKCFVWTPDGDAKDLMFAAYNSTVFISRVVVNEAEEPVTPDTPSLEGFVFSSDNLGGVEEGASVASKSMTVDGVRIEIIQGYATQKPYFHKAAQEGVVMTSGSYFYIGCDAEPIGSIKIYAAQDASLNLFGTLVPSQGDVVYAADEQCFIWTPDGDVQFMTLEANGGSVFVSNIVVLKKSQLPVEEPEQPAVNLEGFVLSAENLGVAEGESVDGKSMTLDGVTLTFKKYYGSFAPYYHKATEEGVVMTYNSYIHLSANDKITAIRIYTAEDASLDLRGSIIGSQGDMSYDAAEKCYVWTPDGDVKDLMLIICDATVFIRNIGVDINGVAASVDAADIASAQVFGTNGALVVNSDNAARVDIFTAAGSLVSSSVVAGRSEIALANGLYIVAINGKAQKVIVK